MNNLHENTIKKSMPDHAGLFKNKIMIVLLAVGLALSTAGCNGKIFGLFLEDNELIANLPFLLPQISSITVTPATGATTPSGVPVDFNVTVTYSNNQTRAMTVEELQNIVWTWDPKVPTILTDITSVTIQNVGINNLPRVTAIKTDYLGGNEDVTLTATYGRFSATADLTINNANLVSIDVTPGAASITRLATQQFTANGTYTDGSIHDVTSASWIVWDSTDDLIATVNSTGKASGVNAGNVTISASDGGSISDAAGLEVTAPTLVSVSVSPVTKTIANGTTVQFRATAIYNNNTTQDVTEAASWSSLDTGVATVNNTTSKGLASGVGAGTTTIRATFSATNGDASLQVTSATLAYLVISAASNKTSIADGTKLQFTATGVYTDNSTQDLTNDSGLTWGSTATAVAAFDFLPGDPKGLITAKSAGATVVSASLGGVNSQDYDLTVTTATLSSITISPKDPIAYIIAYGTTQQFTATGTFSDSTTQDLTTQVDWSSSVDTIANIDSSGLAITTTTTGTTVITARYPAGGPYTRTDSTNLQVVNVPLTAITITPSSKSTYVGETFQYAAVGTFSDGSNTYYIDITNLVVWESSDNTRLIISNSTGSYGLATPIAAGSSNITARRGTAPVITSNTSAVTIAASDTTAPTIVSAQLMSGDRVKVTFSEPMDYTRAMNLANYKVATTSTVTGDCSDNSNFTGTTESISVTDVDFYTQSVYILQLGGGTSNTQYTVLGNKSNLRDVAASPNNLGCPNTATFTGIDTVKPYLVSIVNSDPTKITVTYSEPMTVGGGTTAADNMTNYILAENPSNGIPGDDVTIVSITNVNDTVFIVNLDKSAQSIPYKLTVSASVTDQAPTPNTMGSPRALTFMGNEQLKVVSAQAVDLNHIKVVFSKPVLSGNNVANSAECDDATECHTKYKLFPRSTVNPYPALLGNITSAVRGSGNETNTVTLTHATVQEGFAYTVAAANGKNGDGFDNDEFGTPVRIESETSSTDYVQASPKDRATFVGLGSVIDTIDDGDYFTDPFADGSIFTWSFVYSGKVYLGTNDHNNAAFRFDPDGLNSVLVTFNIESGYTKACTSATGFGYAFAGETCAATEGFNNEYGVVGFNKGTITIGTTDYEVLMLGPLKDGVTHGYYTQDVDTELNWIPFNFAGTGGGNTDSIQTTYAYGANMYLAASSAHSQQAPVVCRVPFTDPESDGVLNLGTPGDMALRARNYIGKQGTPDNYGGTSENVGVDAFISFNNVMYAANNGGVIYSSDYSSMSSEVRSHPNAFRPDDGDASEPTPTEETLVLPTGDPGLGKLSPGQHGVPKLLEYNGRLYMARNVASTSARNTVIRGELWKCTPATTGGTTTCEPGDWEKIISGTETDLPSSGSGTAISLLQNNGTGKLYVGFDHASGVTVWRVASTNPSATTGGLMTSVWTKQGATGLGSSHTKLFSSATINDGTYDYIYLTAGDNSNAIKVYRQRE
jgi:hypothetical protein